MQTLGHYPTDRGTPSPWPDNDMFDGIRKVQKQNGLQQDGVVRPNGPTKWMINSDIKGKRTATSAPHGLGLQRGFDQGDAPASERQVLGKALNRLNLIPASETGNAAAIRSGLGHFQLRTNLKHDGIARPGGPTERKLAAAAWGATPDTSPRRPSSQTSSPNFRTAQSTGGWQNPTIGAMREVGKAIGSAIGTKPAKPKHDLKLAAPKPADDRKWNKHYEPGEKVLGHNTTNFLVRGPVQLERSSPSLSLIEGDELAVVWRPLNPDGTLAPVITDPEGENIEGGGLLSPFGGDKVVLEPPYENRHGWQLRIEVPPQPARNGNSAGIDYRVRLPEGESQIERSPFPRDLHEIE